MTHYFQSTIEKRLFCTFAARNAITLDHENHQGNIRLYTRLCSFCRAVAFFDVARVRQTQYLASVDHSSRHRNPTHRPWLGVKCLDDYLYAPQRRRKPYGCLWS